MSRENKEKTSLHCDLKGELLSTKVTINDLKYNQRFIKDEHHPTFSPFKDLLGEISNVMSQGKKERGKPENAKFFLLEVCVYWGSPALFWL